MSALQELLTLKTHTFDAGLVFSGTASGTAIQGFEQASSYTPKADPNYVFHDSSRDIIVWFLTQNEPLYIYGYQGCGKSTCIKQLAARLNYPVFEITGHGRLEFADLVGHLSMENGSMTFQYGPLALAMRYGGICLINEIDLTSLGSKRIADPAHLKIFGTLKARATSSLDKHGVRFMSGWAIPQELAGEITAQLIKIRDEFMLEKEKFSENYNHNITTYSIY